MNKIRLFILVMIVILLSGCSADYQININKDLSVDETIKVSEKNSFFEQYYFSSYFEVITFIMEPHKEYLTQFNYKYNDFYKDKESGITINGSHKNIEDYINNSKFIEQFYETVSYTVDGNINKIENDSEFLTYTENNPDRFIVSDAKISIKIPYKVVNHNADSVDRIRGIYTWNIAKDTEDKDIILHFDKSIVNVDYYQYVPYALGILLAGVCLFYTIEFFKLNKKNKTL